MLPYVRGTNTLNQQETSDILVSVVTFHTWSWSLPHLFLAWYLSHLFKWLSFFLLFKLMVVWSHRSFWSLNFFYFLLILHLSYFLVSLYIYMHVLTFYVPLWIVCHAEASTWPELVQLFLNKQINKL